MQVTVAALGKLVRHLPTYYLANKMEPTPVRSEGKGEKTYGGRVPMVRDVSRVNQGCVSVKATNQMIYTSPRLSELRERVPNLVFLLTLTTLLIIPYLLLLVPTPSKFKRNVFNRSHVVYHYFLY